MKWDILRNNAFGKQGLKESCVTSIEFAVVVFCSFYVGKLLIPNQETLSLISGLWCAISAIVVLHDNRKATLHAAIIRGLGSLIGAVISGLFLSYFVASFWLLIPMIIITAFLCSLFKFEEGLRLALITVTVVFAVSLVSPDVSGYENAIYRFIESLIGIAFALSARWFTLKFILKRFRFSFLKK
ncbi:FUSC family protein [Paraphotobacterium marinum]|uniref:FUSC family protein n=1 Tax=Paraphotobacterium marinum TaxID=1755811 RepID=UPI0039ECE660